jgi:hypothetical protein
MQKPRTRNWWLCYGILIWGVPFFVVMTVFWATTLFVIESLLEQHLAWKFYADRRMHTVALLIFSFVVSLLGGFYWGFRMWKFYKSKHQIAETKINS